MLPKKLKLKYKKALKKGIDTKEISDQIDSVKDDIDDLTGSIKRDI